MTAWRPWRGALIPAIIATGLCACDNRDECRALQALLERHDRAFVRAKARASVATRVEADARAAEAETTALLKKSGLDASDADITAALEARTAEVRGSTVAYSQNGSAPDSSGPHWTFTWPGGSTRAALAVVQAVAVFPPLLRVSTVLRSAGRWRVEFARIRVDRLPIAFTPQPIVLPPSPDEIPARVGFCGADVLRARIIRQRARIEALAADAARVTVSLPTRASWDGLGRRARREIELESEARRLMEVFMTAAAEAGVSLKAVGQEDDVVIAEFHGGRAVRGRIERQLPEDVLKSVRYGEERPEVLRLMVANRVAQRTAPPESSDQAIDLGLPSPKALERQLKEALSPDGSPSSATE